MKNMHHASEQVQKIQRDPRRRRFKTISTTLTIAVIVGILLLNAIVSIVAARFPISFDMSSDKVFTLSEESENVAKSIKNDVKVVIFANVQKPLVKKREGVYNNKIPKT